MNPVPLAGTARIELLGVQHDASAATGEPAAERAWRDWLERLTLPALPAHEAARRMVIVAPHPDDEVLAAGGLAARHAAAGGRMLIVAVTDGDASHPDDPAWPPERLAAERRRESVRGLARLGIAGASIVRLALPDGGVGAHADRLDQALDALLRSGDRVVTTWRLDGHPDHDATGLTTAAAVTRRGAELLEAPVWMWHRSAPADPGIPWHRLHAHALTDRERRDKRAALAEHETQLAPRRRGEGPVLDDRILARARWPREYYFLS